MKHLPHVHRALLFPTLQWPLPFDLQADLLFRDELVPPFDALSKQQGRRHCQVGNWWRALRYHAKKSANSVYQGLHLPLVLVYMTS